MTQDAILPSEIFYLWEPEQTASRMSAIMVLLLKQIGFQATISKHSTGWIAEVKNPRSKGIYLLRLTVSRQKSSPHRSSKTKRSIAPSIGE